MLSRRRDLGETMTGEELFKLIEEVKVMPLRPGDIIVIRTKHRLPPGAHQQIIDLFKPAFGDHKVLVLDGATEFYIARPLDDETSNRSD